ncbi:MAG: hypothetical protein JWO77_955 [Ilumatobacteraceae bacterium]|nr:hypothetical protein [Ilumatobacteraceae bacterium]
MTDAGAAPDRTDDERFGLDDSFGTLLWSLFLAVSGMFAAYAAARFVAAALGVDQGAGGFLFTGILLASFGTVSIYLTSARPIRAALRQQREAVLASEREIRLESERHRFASQVQDAFEMGETEAEALEVASRALAAISDRRSEVLLADSSRAHLRQAAVSKVAGGAGCGVATPWACPAVRRGQTLRFTSSEELSACPRLIDRGEPCSAICVPVTVYGTPMGVIHVVGAADEGADSAMVDRWEVLAQQAGSRIGVLRAMEASELQASTDPLTGASNRRSLEAKVRQLREAGERYAIVFADLDHFKDLNDTHGHETGDRALRLFADVLRSNVRPDDMVCRYGGEEFVVLLPGLGRSFASERAEGLRIELQGALVAGDVPRISASFGVADSTQAGSAEEVIALADMAMFSAKTTGRDRVVVADATVRPAQVG